MASFASRTPAEDAGIMALTPEAPKQPTAKVAAAARMMVLRMCFSSASKLCEAKTRAKALCSLPGGEVINLETAVESDLRAASHASSWHQAAVRERSGMRGCPGILVRAPCPAPRMHRSSTTTVRKTTGPRVAAIQRTEMKFQPGAPSLARSPRSDIRSRRHVRFWPKQKPSARSEYDRCDPNRKPSVRSCR